MTPDPSDLALTASCNSLNHLCHVINDWATSKGWNETPDSLSHKAEQIALMHSELSECLEYVRKKTEPQTCKDCGGHNFSPISGHWHCVNCDRKYETVEPHDDHVPSLTGEAAELADVLIRIFHYCGRRNINLGEAVRLKHLYNLARPYRHGKNL